MDRTKYQVTATRLQFMPMLQAHQDQDLLVAKVFDDNNIEAITSLTAEQQPDIM